MRIERHGYFRKIDFVFYNEQRIREAVADERSARGEVTERNGSGVGDPTATTAIRNITPLRTVRLGSSSLDWPELWLQVIDKTKRWASADCLAVSEDHYNHVPREETMARMFISQTTYYNKLDDYCSHAAFEAIGMGLIKLF